jgi:predicted ABC-type ATPase
MNPVQRLLIIAGPNGAVKSTFAREYLPNEADCSLFVNADLIAAGLSPFDPASAAIRAGRLMLEEIDGYAAAGTSFAFETTLSGRTYARRIVRWQQAGFRVELIFLRLPAVEAAIARVAARVQQGGHDIPENVIRRRYAAGWKNFENLYKPLVNAWTLYDNSGETPVILDAGENL